MRRVRVVNKAEHLEPYLQRVCQVLGCCSELISATRYPMGHCNQTSCVKGQGNRVLLVSCSQRLGQKDKKVVLKIIVNSEASSVPDLTKFPMI